MVVQRLATACLDAMGRWVTVIYVLHICMISSLPLDYDEIKDQVSYAFMIATYSFSVQMVCCTAILLKRHYLADPFISLFLSLIIFIDDLVDFLTRGFEDTNNWLEV
mgnify:FL=1